LVEVCSKLEGMAIGSELSELSELRYSVWSKGDSNMASTAPKPFVFVLMPFDPSFDDIYRLGIQPACKDAGAYCERVDEQVYEGSMLLRIYNQISKADIVIADMTGKNPNVFYETGYAHALGKRTILLTKQTDDIPFDLKHYSHIIYQGKINDLKTQLKKRIKYYIDRPEKPTHDDSNVLDYYIQKIDISKCSHVEFSIDLMDKYLIGSIDVSKSKCRDIRLIIELDINNKSNTSINLSNYVFSVLFPIDMKARATNDINNNVIYLPDGSTMISKKATGNLYPKAWHHERIYVMYDDNDLLIPKSFHCKFQVFTEIGMREISFWINLRYKPPPAD
jgi:hypothetical protein